MGREWIAWARNNLESVLIVFDLDGTLVDEQLRVRNEDLQAIAEVRRRGAGITLATGRTYGSASPFVSRFHVALPVILCNGAMVVDPRTEGVLYQRKIPADMAVAVLKGARQHGLEPVIYTDGMRGDPCVNALTPPMKEFLLLEGLHEAQIEVLEELVQQEPPVKIQLIGDPPALASLQKHLLTENPAFPVVMSQDDYLEVTPPGVSKGFALARLCRSIHVPLSHTLAFGDGRNDQEMLDRAGFSVAMATAPEELRRRAHLSASSISGVLKLLL
jgi:Cof subfamily protein (haloacid dehalogenase superfamily)